MALHHLSLLLNIGHSKMLPLLITKSSPLLKPKSSYVPHPMQCMASTTVSDQAILRRSANFEPSVWHYDYIQSLKSKYVEELCAEQRNGLREEARMMLCKVENSLQQLELIDVLQRLGVAYHFNNEIKNILDDVYCNKDTSKRKKNLYDTALEFRLLRQHGYNVSAEVFDSFQDGKCNFKGCLSVDIEGMLSLYEASFYSMENETILDKARDFSSKYLKEFVEKNKDAEISFLEGHALEIPLHWRMPRLEARWFIDVYEKRQNMSPALLKLAKLDFNMVQIIHQEDLKHTSRWWQRTALGEKLSFARDRLVENFIWTVGLAFQPHFGYFRRVMTKVNALITTIDDIYDVYGTLEELELFTDVVDRWNINAMDTLPEYMQICFLQLYNFINEVACDTLKEKHHQILPYLVKAWADLCKSYLIEAKWYFNGYTPSLKEYIENAWISISAPVILVHVYFLVANPIRKEVLNDLEEYSNIIRSSSMILRLADDLGTSKREMETGDVPKSIQCYMHETGASEAYAREHIKSMICTTWKKINEEVNNSSFPQSFKEIAVNLGRMSLCMYQHGDGHTVQDLETKNRISSLLIEAIPIA